MEVVQYEADPFGVDGSVDDGDDVSGYGGSGYGNFQHGPVPEDYPSVWGIPWTCLQRLAKRISHNNERPGTISPGSFHAV